MEKNKLGGAFSAELRGVYRGLVGKTEGNRELVKPRRSWENNIKIDLKEVGYRNMDWIDVSEDRDRWWAPLNVVMNIRVPLIAGNLLPSSEPISFSRRILLHGVST
jgi:hypothetical protein